MVVYRVRRVFPAPAVEDAHYFRLTHHAAYVCVCIVDERTHLRENMLAPHIQQGDEFISRTHTRTAPVRPAKEFVDLFVCIRKCEVLLLCHAHETSALIKSQ